MVFMHVVYCLYAKFAARRRRLLSAVNAIVLFDSSDNEPNENILGPKF